MIATGTATDVAVMMSAKTTVKLRNKKCALWKVGMCLQNKDNFYQSVYICCNSCDKRLHGPLYSYFNKDGEEFICWKPECVKKKDEFDESADDLILDSGTITSVAIPFQTAKQGNV